MEYDSEQSDRCFKEFLAYRGIETPCIRCGGLGVRGYGDTSTWRRSIGGQMITNDICDHCWGSGDENKKWLNLRRLEQSRLSLDASCFKLVAVIDGIKESAEVSLYLERDSENIFDIPWPEDWPKSVSKDFLIRQGFEVISA